jgi:hypothetical protein
MVLNPSVKEGSRSSIALKSSKLCSNSAEFIDTRPAICSNRGVANVLYVTLATNYEDFVTLLLACLDNNINAAG